MISIAEPATRNVLLDALARTHEESTTYWTAFTTQQFFAKSGESWSAAETVRHLIKSTRPVAKALSMPRIVLRAMFGKAKHQSVSFDELVATYRGKLDAGGKAGRFAPSEHSEEDLESWRMTILSQFTGVHGDLRNVVQKWTDAALESYQLPHPLLGKLTVREMLLFTIYHHFHHMNVIQRRLAQ